MGLGSDGDEEGELVQVTGVGKRSGKWMVVRVVGMVDGGAGGGNGVWSGCGSSGRGGRGARGRMGVAGGGWGGKGIVTPPA